MLQCEDSTQDVLPLTVKKAQKDTLSKMPALTLNADEHNLVLFCMLHPNILNSSFSDHQRGAFLLWMALI